MSVYSTDRCGKETCLLRLGLRSICSSPQIFPEMHVTLAGHFSPVAIRVCFRVQVELPLSAEVRNCKNRRKQLSHSLTLQLKMDHSGPVTLSRSDHDAIQLLSVLTCSQWIMHLLQ